jgi:glycosyltransferase involved in cell wall biosynthesis
MWNTLKVSVILPTYNEKESIRAFIMDLNRHPVVDEVIVVNNNAAPGTSEEVAGTGAREVCEPVQGYGAAIQRGFDEATGDLIMVFEPDGTFQAHDVHKMLAYAEDFDVVYGSRTVKELIWQGANMGLFLKWGNYAVAKLMEFLFNTTSLTDVGCTVRCVQRRTLGELRPFFSVQGSFFGPEMMLISILQGKRIIQVPVNYARRVGHSSVTGNPWVAFTLGLRMIAMILEYRWRSLVDPGAFGRRPGPGGQAPGDGERPGRDADAGDCGGGCGGACGGGCGGAGKSRGWIWMALLLLAVGALLAKLKEGWP